MTPRMTGLSNPLNTLTIAALRDLGYTVDYFQGRLLQPTHLEHMRPADPRRGSGSV